MGSYTDDFLSKLRNRISIDQVIDRLMIDIRQGKNLRRFRCPLCDRFHTATNSTTNLGRCFECQKNFNPIDLVMAATAYDFIGTVEFLKKHFLSRPTES
ncbi:MAG: hypothetical protein GY699_01530 [Desulfobacteraceae bacterium]|jgi:DNA primase|nr:hypothetical protein [Desulfobacteraceae bacterium]